MKRSRRINTALAGAVLSALLGTAGVAAISTVASAAPVHAKVHHPVAKVHHPGKKSHPHTSTAPSSGGVSF